MGATSRPGRFTSVDRLRGTHWIGSLSGECTPTQSEQITWFLISFLIRLDTEACVAQDVTNSLAGIEETWADEWSLNRQVNKQTSAISIIKQNGLREIPLVTENQKHTVRSFCRAPSGVWPITRPLKTRHDLHRISIKSLPWTSTA